MWCGVVWCGVLRMGGQACAERSSNQMHATRNGQRSAAAAQCMRETCRNACIFPPYLPPGQPSGPPRCSGGAPWWRVLCGRGLQVGGGCSGSRAGWRRRRVGAADGHDARPRDDINGFNMILCGQSGLTTCAWPAGAMASWLHPAGTQIRGLAGVCHSCDAIYETQSHYTRIKVLPARGTPPRAWPAANCVAEQAALLFPGRQTSLNDDNAGMLTPRVAYETQPSGSKQPCHWRQPRVTWPGPLLVAALASAKHKLTAACKLQLFTAFC